MKMHVAVKRLHKNLESDYLHVRFERGETKEGRTLLPFSESSWSGVSATNQPAVGRKG